MFGGQHRSDEAEKARASWGDTSETRQPQRHDSSAIGRVCSCAEKIRMKSLEMVGVVRDNAVTGEMDFALVHSCRILPITRISGHATRNRRSMKYRAKMGRRI